jgi:ATP-dependent helicase/nuclease subunit A
MSGRLVVPADTEARQRRASDPATSAWVSANAGSGKTHVLTQRVIRCLLAGASPDRILCLTFTKAAAANMSNRVFRELGRWAVADDADLAARIAATDGGAPERVAPSRLARARRLFAEAIETPGGLKIQTIHAFCESVLKQFPLEADLGGGFEILDERATRDLVGRAREAVLVEASAGGPATPLGAALAEALAAAGESGFDKALGAVIGARDDWLAWLREAGDVEAALADLAATLAVDPALRDADVVAEMLASPEFDAGLLTRLAEAFAASSANDVAQAGRLARARDASLGAAERLAGWWEVFFTKTGPRAARTLATKKILDAFPDFPERAARETARLEQLDDTRAALAAFRATAALLRLADAVIGRYEAAKRAASAVDFDDLVGRTADLLSHRPAAAWVQYKLDKGIDHILIDEAQDTNPRQWRIVRGLAEEFFAGEGARRLARTVFAVGDEKQSIYSFQGAAPETFSQNRDHFRAAAEGASRAFVDVGLVMSFRSVPAVLSAVDAVFDDPAVKGRILASADDYTRHTALRDRAPGRVEVWPVEAPEKVEEPEDWSLPLDRVTASLPHVRLARRIADEIERLTAPGARLEGTGAPVRRRDILVLVRKRGPFVDAMNRVLEDRGIPVAGQDRLRLTDHVAVLDLVALARALVMPEDDLSLAAVLKSPLFGLDDDDLIAIAAERGETESLAAALARRAGDDARLAAAAVRLERWRGFAERLPTYEFFARVLCADGGRRAFVARLGSEADDVLDEFLGLALAADRGPAPSLMRFVEGLALDPPEIKREMDEARDEVRVMTVHGSKGLEAAVVFLVDTGAPPTSSQHAPPLLRLPADRPGRTARRLVWSRGHRDPRAFDAAKAAARAAAEDEYLRLLYVAMTRAGDRLIVCGHAGARGVDAASWAAVVERGLAAGGDRIAGDDGRQTLVWSAGPAAPVAAEPVEPAAEATAVVRPSWVDRPPPETAASRRLTPSMLGGEDRPSAPSAVDALEAALAPESPERLRGLLTHRLLEVLPSLPEAERAAAARRHVAARGARLAQTARDEIVAEVEAILADPRFAPVFAAGSRAEVAIVGDLPDARGGIVAVSGRIDRLAVTADEVLVIDFKSERTDAARAEASAAHVAQLALYRRLLAETFPGRRIRCALLWTAIPRLDEIAAERLEAAVRRIAIL